MKLKNQYYIPSKQFKKRPGLYYENGKVMLDDSEFCGIGVNYFGAFTNAFFSPEKNEIDEIFALMKAHGIRYCRANWGMFWPTNYLAMFKDIDKYFEVMDSVVRKAEENDIGLICSMFWNVSGILGYYGEHVDAWKDPDSDSRKFMADYVKTVVSRYKESPAIWMWEFGNEFNLALDLPNRWDFMRNYEPITEVGMRLQRDERDFWTTELATPLLTEFARLCKEFDVYGRMVTSGNGEPRPTQYLQRVLDTWPNRPDTRAEMAKTLSWHNPDPMDCVSVHSYGEFGRFEGGNDYGELFDVFMEESAKIGKAFFVGEFHGLNIEHAKRTVDAIVERRVPLACTWAVGSVEYTMDKEPAVRDELMAYIQNANEQLAKLTK